jgi:hypothetical protein
VRGANRTAEGRRWGLREKAWDLIWVERILVLSLIRQKPVFPKGKSVTRMMAVTCFRRTGDRAVHGGTAQNELG